MRIILRCPLRCNQQHPKVNANENHSQVSPKDNTASPAGALRMPHGCPADAYVCACGCAWVCPCMLAGVLGCVCVCPCVCLRVHAGVPAGVRGCTHGGVHASLILKCRFTNFLHFFNRYPLVIHRTPQVIHRYSKKKPQTIHRGRV